MAQQHPGKRAEARASMEAAILEAGRRQLVQRGAAALSLREVARSIGVVSSAVYRYVESRDALLTLLVADAYTQLGNVVEESLRARAGEGWQSRLRTLAFTMRDWALAHPEQWGLLYGAPVPGYEAPADITTEPGVRVMAQLLDIMSSADWGGSTLSGDLRVFLQAGNADLDRAASPEQSLLAVQAWCTIVGTISMEIFGQLGPEPQANPLIGQGILEAQLRLLGGPLSPQRD